MPEPRGPEVGASDDPKRLDEFIADLRATEAPEHPPAVEFPSPPRAGEADPLALTPEKAEQRDAEARGADRSRFKSWGEVRDAASPAGPGEADTREALAAEISDYLAPNPMAPTRATRGAAVLLADAAGAIRALLARLRESRDAHEQSVLAALVQAGALRAEVARLGAENERLNKVAGENFAVAVEAQERIATARAEEREAFTPKPTDQDKSGGWSISTAWIQSVQDGAKEDVSMEQVEAVLVSAAALRTREAAP